MVGNKSNMGLLFFLACGYIISFTKTESTATSQDQYTSLDFKKEIESQPKNTETKNNKKLNVIFFTPWTESKEMVINYAKKIDIFIPCWFDLKPEKFNDKYHTQVSLLIIII